MEHILSVSFDKFWHVYTLLKPSVQSSQYVQVSSYLL